MKGLNRVSRRAATWLAGSRGCDGLDETLNGK